MRSGLTAGLTSQPGRVRYGPKDKPSVAKVTAGSVNTSALNTQAGAAALTLGTNVTAALPTIDPVYTVATLPASAGVGMVTGAKARVSDALSPSQGATVVGGVAVNCSVMYNGSAWQVTGGSAVTAVANGGTGSSVAATALSNLGALPASGGTATNVSVAGYTETTCAMGTVSYTCDMTHAIDAYSFLTATLTASNTCAFTMPTATA